MGNFVMEMKMAVIKAACGICSLSEAKLLDRLEKLYIESFKAGLNQMITDTTLYHTVNAMMAVIGADGQVCTKQQCVLEVMDALHNVDGGTWQPPAQAEPASRKLDLLFDEIMTATAGAEGRWHWLRAYVRRNGPCLEAAGVTLELGEAEANSSSDSELQLPPGSRARGVLLQAALLVGELSKGLEKGDPTWDDLQKFGRDFDAVMTGTGDTEQQRRDAELQRLRTIEHHVWHLYDDLCDDGSETLKIDKQVSAADLDALHELLPEDHPNVTQAAIEAEGTANA